MRRRLAVARALGLLCLAASGVGLLTGCVTGRFGRATVNEPIDPTLLRALQPGRDDLASCLDALGAPLDVREYQVGPDRRSGVALVYFWSQRHGWSVQVSGSISDEASVSYEFDWAGTDQPGFVLWFDRDLVLERYREGLVGDLLQQRRRPSPVDAERQAARHRAQPPAPPL